MLVPGFGCGVCLAGDGGRAVAPGVPGCAPAPTAPGCVSSRVARVVRAGQAGASVPSLVWVSLVITTKRSRPAPGSSPMRPAAPGSPGGHSATRSASTSSRTKQAARWSLTTPTACIIA